MADVELRMRRGDRVFIDGTLYDGAGNRQDLEHPDVGTLRFTAKRRRGDSQEAAVIAKSTGAGITYADQEDEETRGDYVVEIGPDDTKDLSAQDHTLFIDVQADGGPYTTISGTLTVLADVTTPSS